MKTGCAHELRWDWAVLALLLLVASTLCGQEVPSAKWTLSQPAGLAFIAFDLRVECDLSGADLRYTTDGSSPTLESPKWAGPMRVERTTLFRWAAVVDGTIADRFGAAYLFADPAFASFSSDLPIVVVDTFGVDIDEEGTPDSRAPKRPAWTVIIDRDEVTHRALTSGQPHFSGRAGLRVRGQSSTMFPKKQYSFELWDEEDGDADAALLGFAKESDWILHAPYSDKTLMRNVLAYQWFREMGHYAAGTRYVELFFQRDADGLLTLSDYAGVYILMEKIKRDPGRVAMAKLDETITTEPDISGGYIFKKDKGTDDDVHFRTRHGHQFGLVEPDEPTAPQLDFLSDHLTAFETALDDAEFADPVKGYASYIDVLSFIDVHIHVEMCRNVDGFRLSTYYHKDRDGKIVMGPVWDYNLSLGNTTMRDGQYPEGWYHETISRHEYTYFDQLFADPNFELQHWDRYYQLRQTLFSRNRLTQQIDAIAEELAESQERNFKKWPILGDHVWQNPDGFWERKTHADEVEWLKEWLFRRLEWMDEQFTPPPTMSVATGALAPGSPVTVKLASRGRSLNDPHLLYTVDGADPRSRDGKPVASAQSLPSGASIPLEGAATVHVRAYDGRAWSALAAATFAVDPNVSHGQRERSTGGLRWFGVFLAIALALLIVRAKRSQRRPVA